MDKNIVLGTIVLVVAAVVLFNLSSFTGNVAKETGEPLLTVKNPNVRQGYLLEVNARNIGTTQEFKIYTDAGGYTGKRFFTRASRCERQANGMNECDVQFRIPASMNAGRYYVQTKNARTGELTGNRALFTVN